MVIKILYKSWRSGIKIVLRLAESQKEYPCPRRISKDRGIHTMTFPTVIQRYHRLCDSQNTDISSLTALPLSTSTAKRTYSAWKGCSLRSVTIMPRQ